jgi:hypothetical protein
MNRQQTAITTCLATKDDARLYTKRIAWILNTLRHIHIVVLRQPVIFFLYGWSILSCMITKLIQRQKIFFGVGRILWTVNFLNTVPLWSQVNDTSRKTYLPVPSPHDIQIEYFPSIIYLNFAFVWNSFTASKNQHHSDLNPNTIYLLTYNLISVVPFDHQ